MRPCALHKSDPHTEPRPDSCPLCRLYLTSPKVREAWDRDDCPPPSRPDPAAEVARSAPAEPVGRELKRLLAELGVNGGAGCGCDDMAGRMNRWGVAGCQLHRGEVLSWLRDRQRAAGWGTTLAAGVRLARLAPGSAIAAAGDPAAWLLDEAIRRATLAAAVA